MRYLRYAFLACLGLVLVCVALANRAVVGLKLLPDEIAQIIGFNRTIELPLFVAIFIGIVAGLFIGFVWEWLREYRFRAEAARKTREASSLKREVHRLKGEKHEGKDEVLALLEQTR